MDFLRRLGRGGGGGEQTEATDEVVVDQAELDRAERDHELEVLREDQARLDELAQRQLKYAQYAWTPPPQGGERRADDADGGG
jgi:hypothetical protein